MSYNYPILFSFITYQRIFNMINTTGDISGAGLPYLYWEHVLTKMHSFLEPRKLVSTNLLFVFNNIQILFCGPSFHRRFFYVSIRSPGFIWSSYEFKGIHNIIQQTCIPVSIFFSGIRPPTLRKSTSNINTKWQNKWPYVLVSLAKTIYA